MKQSMLFGIVGLLIGLTAGFFVANSINREMTPASSAAPVVDSPAPNQSGIETSQGVILADVSGTLQKAEAEPQNFAVQMKTGDMYAQIGRFDKAIEFYLRGVALKPTDFQANVVLANAYFDSRKFEDAETYYTRALIANPKDVNARTDLGTTFVERQNPNYDRAIKEFTTVLATQPNHEPSLYYLGIAYFRKGDTDAANKALTDLERANPASELVPRLRQNISGN